MIRSLNGKTPKIAESAFISEAAYVVGDVEIGENSSVWPGAVIRADFSKMRIGKNTAVEDNSVIHAGLGNVLIGDDVIIGHGVVIDSGRIGNNVLIGMNSTILQDAEIGDLCIIAAGCVVKEGMKIPAKSLVAGVPGEIKGEAPQQQLLLWTQGGGAYAKLAEQYKEQGL
jgi:carbonic anhydrase/acetyltransferase-like protein (isoleucine patch superfamily)